MEKIYDVPVELVEAIQARQIELDGLKNMLAFCYSTTDYIIPEERITKLENDYNDKFTEYSLLKLKVEDIFSSDFNNSKMNWSLDFSTCKVRVKIDEE